MIKRSSLKDFETVSLLGKGNFGTVYKVKRLLDDNVYVMKVIDISIMTPEEQYQAMNEANILGHLESPFIVSYYDSFIESNALHIVMEYCEKGDLHQLLKNSSEFLPEDRIWSYFIQMCFALEYLHSQRVLHRDFKTMNVFLAKDESVKIGDLGVAKVMSSTSTFAHTLVGTPYYLSPELCEERPYNTKSDIWALGCILYEMCTLKHPFEASNQGALILKILRARYSPIPCSYSSELRDLIDMLLKKDFQRRPSISFILRLAGIREKAVGLALFIPENSALNASSLKLKPAAYSQKFRKTDSSRQQPTRVRKGAPAGLSKQAQRQKYLRPHPNKYAKLRVSEVPSLPDEILEVQNLPELQPRKHKTWAPFDLSLINQTLDFECFYKPVQVLYYREEGGFGGTLQTVDWDLSVTAISLSDSDSESEHLVWVPEGDSSKELLSVKLQETSKRETKLQHLITVRVEEITKTLQYSLFSCIYTYFTARISSDEELTGAVQQEIEEFIYTNLPENSFEISLSLYKLFYLETELFNTQEVLRSIRFELL